MAIDSNIGYDTGVLEDPPVVIETTSSRIGHVTVQLENPEKGWVPYWNLVNQTILMKARYAGQIVRVGGSLYETTQNEQYLRITGSGLVELGEGWWADFAVVNGNYTGPFFDGDSQSFEYLDQTVDPKWSGERHYSTSYFIYYNPTFSEFTAKWSRTEDRRYSIGLDRGMLYIDSIGNTWSGLISVAKKNLNSDIEPFYIDGVIFRAEPAMEDFAATLTAYTYPDEFEQCIGQDSSERSGLIVSGQPSKPFSLSYRTFIGDGNGHQKHYKIHFVYNCVAIESDRNYETIGESGEAEPFSFELVGIPVHLAGFRPTSYYSIDSRRANPIILASLENILYGQNGTTPILPSIEELKTFMRG